jgi:hypothetical protein
MMIMLRLKMRSIYDDCTDDDDKERSRAMLGKEPDMGSSSSEDSVNSLEDRANSSEESVDKFPQPVREVKINLQKATITKNEED